MDDSTVQENNPAYLSSHLHQVVADLDADDRLSLMAIHIGHMTEKSYSKSWHVDVLTELGAVMVDILIEGNGKAGAHLTEMGRSLRPFQGLPTLFSPWRILLPGASHDAAVRDNFVDNFGETVVFDLRSDSSSVLVRTW